MFQHDCIHIEPHEDKALGLSFDKIYDESYFFRFLNLDQYKAWFYNPIWRQNLSKYGMMLSVYEIEKRKLRKSPHQVAFRREDAILIERFDPFHFY